MDSRKSCRNLATGQLFQCHLKATLSGCLCDHKPAISRDTVACTPFANRLVVFTNIGGQRLGARLRPQGDQLAVGHGR